MPQFAYKGKSTNYQIEGKGEVVLLIHGFLENLSMWDAIADKLRKEFKVVRLDLPGFGKSPFNEVAGEISFYSDCVHSLLNHLDIDKLSVFGHSMGGYIALDFARSYPEKLEQLCLYHSTASEDSDNKKHDRDRAIKAVLNKQDTYLKTAIPFLFPRELIENCATAVQQMISDAQKLNANGIASALEAMKLRTSQKEMLKNLPCEKTYIASTLDPLLNYENLRVEANDCGAQFLLLENAGHMSHWEAPALAIDAIYSCLKK